MLRNGSGQWDMNGESVNHWFDGHALIHKFEIKDGQVCPKIVHIKMSRSNIFEHVYHSGSSEQNENT